MIVNRPLEPRPPAISAVSRILCPEFWNLFSTALGIPLAWGVPLLPALAFASSDVELPRSLESFVGLLYWPFWLMPWGDKAIQSWSVLVALAFLIPLFLATSVLSEAWLLRFLHPAASRRQRWAVSLRANVWSYSFLALVLLVFVVAKHITGEA